MACSPIRLGHFMSSSKYNTSVTTVTYRHPLTTPTRNMIRQTSGIGKRFPWQQAILTYWLSLHLNTILLLLGQRLLSRKPRHIFYKGERRWIFSWHFGVNFYLLSCTHWRTFRVPTERRRCFLQNQGTQKKKKTCEFWSFRRSVTENSFLPGYSAAWTGNQTPIFRQNTVPSSSKLDRIYQTYIPSKRQDMITHWRRITTRKKGPFVLSDLFGGSDWKRRWRIFSWFI